MIVYKLLVHILSRYSQTREILQMEQDVDLDLLREREDAIKKLEAMDFLLTHFIHLICPRF